MRPTDPHQSPSRRPNLISSQRRASGEINILAMLEGQAPRPLAHRLAMLPAALWYGGAGALACALVAALAWLARGAGPRAPAPPPVVAIASVPEAGPPDAAAAEPGAAPMPASASAVVPSALPPARPAPLQPAIPGDQATTRPALVARGLGLHPVARIAAIVHGPGPATHLRRARTAAHSVPAAEVDTDVALISAIIRHASTPPQSPADGGAALPDQP